ncbi:hypothetical protein SBV1_1530017 [Verrucomicrobia bacterium]|nr:hypothetical protein SBV1_1530017 [Verrucomicrobiota bacterium]
MGWWQRSKNREAQRFYLLPGMGGRAMRKKRWQMLRWSIAAGLLVSAMVGCLLYILGSL